MSVADASALTGRIGFVETASDRLNPILVKETRQSLKSRQFIATFMLMLAASWLVSMFGILFSAGALENSQTGQGFFYAYYGVLAFAIFIVVPFGAFRSLANERDYSTEDLLKITTLSPRRIVWGKLTSAVLQLFIYYSAITPFIAFTSLFKGTNLSTMVFVLVVSFFASVHIAMLALMLSTLARQRQVQMLMSLVLLAWLAGAFFTAYFFIGVAMQTEPAFDQAWFWWTVAVIASYYIAFFWLYLQMATAQLTFETGDRSSGVRVVCAAIVVLSLAWVGVGLWYSQPGAAAALTTGPAGAIQFIASISTAVCIWLAAVGLFAVTEDEFLSRRVRRDLPRFILFRFVKLPFLPGGGRGVLYAFGLAALVMGVGYAGMYWANSWPATGQNVQYERYQLYLGALGLYLLIYLGLGSALGRWIRAVSSDIRAAHARVLLIFMLAGGSMIPALLYTYDSRLTDTWPLLWITSPVMTAARILDDLDLGWTQPVLLIVGTLVLLLNVPAVLRGMGEVLGAPVRTSRRETPPAA